MREDAPGVCGGGGGDRRKGAVEGGRMGEGAGVGGAWVGGAGGDLRDVLIVFALPGCDCSASSSSISILVARSWFQHIKFVETKSKFEDFRGPS